MSWFIPELLIVTLATLVLHALPAIP